MTNHSVKFMVADDHPLFRSSLIALLKKHFKSCLVDESSNGEALLDLVMKNEYDLIFLDIKMPGINGAQVARIIHDQKPQQKMIAISMYEDETHVITMFESGVRAYLTKMAPEQEIVTAIQNVLNNSYYVSGKKMNDMLLNQIGKWQDQKTSPISEREKEILLLICNGHSNKEIADKLFLSVHTIDNHRNHLLEKTGARNTAGLVLYATRKGWI